MKEETYPIDFVCPWVDGNDPEWQREYYKYAPATEGDKREERFRDWGLMRYWFRGVEKYAPWVNKVYFVTCGHYPNWLNLDAPKLCFVRHDEYIPKKYLPVFNSHPIELWMHRLPGLSEHFVYFNDDIFLTDNVYPHDFFCKGLPRDMAIQNALARSLLVPGIEHIVLNCIAVINAHFSKKTVIKNFFSKWFHPSYGVNVFRNIALSPWNHFTGFVNPHLMTSFLKSTFDEVWTLYGEYIENCSMSKLRSDENVSQYLMRYWQLVKGDFHPTNVMKGCRSIYINDETFCQIEKCLQKGKQRVLLLNDGIVDNFEQKRRDLVESFKRFLPHKSTFEL